MVTLWSVVAFAAPIVHVPPVTGAQGADLVLVVEAQLADAEGLVVHYRASERADWRETTFSRRPDDAWVAVLPGKELDGRAVEYWIADAQGQARFASQAAPYRLPLVSSTEAEDLQQRELERLSGQRTTFEAHGAWLPHGAPEGVSDAHWRAGGTVTYRPLGVVRSLSFGYERMRGTGVVRDEVWEGETSSEVLVQDEPTDSERWGVDYGYASVELRVVERFSVTPVLALGADSLTFIGGGGARARIGLDPGTNFQAWAFGMAGGTGWDTGVELTFATVPRVPMAVAVKASNWPNGRIWGIGMQYRLWIPLGPNADLELGLTYQGRNSDYGALGGRGGLSWSF